MLLLRFETKALALVPPFYAMAIFFKRSRLPTPIFDGRFVAKYARPIDKVIGAAHLISVFGAIICLCIVSYYQKG